MHLAPISSKAELPYVKK